MDGKDAEEVLQVPSRRPSLPAGHRARGNVRGKSKLHRGNSIVMDSRHAHEIARTYVVKHKTARAPFPLHPPPPTLGSTQHSSFACNFFTLHTCRLAENHHEDEKKRQMELLAQRISGARRRLTIQMGQSGITARAASMANAAIRPGRGNRSSSAPERMPHCSSTGALLDPLQCEEEEYSSDEDMKLSQSTSSSSDEDEDEGEVEVEVVEVEVTDGDVTMAHWRGVRDLASAVASGNIEAALASASTSASHGARAHASFVMSNAIASASASGSDSTTRKHSVTNTLAKGSTTAAAAAVEQSLKKAIATHSIMVGLSERGQAGERNGAFHMLLQESATVDEMGGERKHSVSGRVLKQLKQNPQEALQMRLDAAEADLVRLTNAAAEEAMREADRFGVLTKRTEAAEAELERLKAPEAHLKRGFASRAMLVEANATLTQELLLANEQRTSLACEHTAMLQKMSLEVRVAQSEAEVASKSLDECELSVSSPTPKCVVDVWKRELAAAQRIIAEQADELWRLSEALRVSETAQAAMRDTMGAMAESAESVAESAAASASVDESTRTEIADTERELATARAEVVAAEDELNLSAVRSAEDLESDKRAMDVAMNSAQDELNAVSSGAAVSRRELAASLATTNVELASLNVLRRDPTQLAEATEVEAAEATRESFVYGSVRYWRRQKLLRPIWQCARNGRALPTRQGHCHAARDFAKAIVAGTIASAVASATISMRRVAFTASDVAAAEEEEEEELGAANEVVSAVEAISLAEHWPLAVPHPQPKDTAAAEDTLVLTQQFIATEIKALEKQLDAARVTNAVAQGVDAINRSPDEETSAEHGRKLRALSAMPPPPPTSSSKPTSFSPSKRIEEKARAAKIAQAALSARVALVAHAARISNAPPLPITAELSERATDAVEAAQAALAARSARKASAATAAAAPIETRIALGAEIARAARLKFTEGKYMRDEEKKVIAIRTSSALRRPPAVVDTTSTAQGLLHMPLAATVLPAAAAGAAAEAAAAAIAATAQVADPPQSQHGEVRRAAHVEGPGATLVLPAGALRLPPPPPSVWEGTKGTAMVDSVRRRIRGIATYAHAAKHNEIPILAGVPSPPRFSRTSPSRRSPPPPFLAPRLGGFGADIARALLAPSRSAVSARMRGADYSASIMMRHAHPHVHSRFH